MTAAKRKWEVKDLSRFVWEVVDTHTADQAQKPFDWAKHVEELCASAPEDELTLQQPTENSED